MGMYTELSFGALLKRSTPIEVVAKLKEMIGENKSEEGLLEPKKLYTGFFRFSSCYFGAESMAILSYCEPLESYRLTARCHLKNYDDEIEHFLAWIKPYIEQGSGARDMYAVVIYEEDAEPTIYYLRGHEND